MPPNALLMAKLAWLLLVVGGFWIALRGPYVPVVGLLARLPREPVLLSIAFWGAGLCLLGNRCVRPAAAVAGGVVLIAPFESLTTWHPYAWVCGCILILAALETTGDRPRFLRALLVLVHGAALLSATRPEGWAHSALAPAWLPGDYAGLLPRWFANLAGARDPVALLHTATLVGCTVIFLGMLVPRLRAAAGWLALLFYTLLYVALGHAEVALFGGAVALAQIAILDWPRFVIVVWPRSCGWPLSLRRVLDRADFERRTDWPRPPDPDAELEAWFDVRPVAGAHAVQQLVLVFPAFYFAVLTLLALSHMILPRVVGVPLNGSIVLALLGFSLFAWGGSLRAHLTKRPPPPSPAEQSPRTAADVEPPAPAPGDNAAGIQETAEGEPPARSTRSPPDPAEIIIDIDTPPPQAR